MITDITIEPSIADEFGLATPPAILNSELEQMLASHSGCAAFKRVLGQITDRADLLQIMSSYIYFNSVFGSGVANLAGEIGSRQYLFRDPDESIEIVADRSVEVGAQIFFAATDEFGSGGNGRSTHRTLAQATLKGIGSFFGYETRTLNQLTEPNEQVLSAVDQVRDGYALNQMTDEEKIFRALGFHMSSEVLADHEFNILNDYLHNQHADLVDYLRTAKVEIGGIEVPPYRWIETHTVVEADHFNAALNGANLALRYYAGLESPAQLKRWIITGFKDFMEVQLQLMNGLMK